MLATRMAAMASSSALATALKAAWGFSSAATEEATARVAIKVMANRFFMVLIEHSLFGER